MDVNKPIVQTVVTYGNRLMLVIGTVTGKLYAFEPKTMAYRISAISNNPLRSISVDSSGCSDFIIVFDGVYFYQVDLDTLVPTQLSTQPNVSQLIIHWTSGGSQIYQVCSDGVSNLKKKSLFKLKEEQVFQLDARIVQSYSSQEFICYTDDAMNLWFYSFEHKQTLPLLLLDSQSNCVAETLQQLNPPCTCCQPKVRFFQQNLIVVWHSTVIVVNFGSSSCESLLE